METINSQDFPELCKCMNASVQQYTNVLSSGFRATAPMAAASAQKIFGPSMNLLSNSQTNAAQVPGVNVASNLIQSNTVPVAMLVMMVVMSVTGEPEAACAVGTAVAAPASGAPVDVPVLTGPPAFPAVPTGSRPATIEVGAGLQRFYEWFSHGYSLQLKSGLVEVMNSMVADIGMLQATTYEGFGQADLPLVYYINKLNNQLKAIGSPWRYLPQTGEVVDEEDFAALYPPTATSSTGAGANLGFNQKIAQLKCPMLLFPGQPIQAQLLQIPDSIYAKRVLDEVSEPGTNMTTYGSEFTENLGSGEDQVGYAGSVDFKVFDFGVEMKFYGFYATKNLCNEYIAACDSGVLAMDGAKAFGGTQLPAGVRAPKGLA